jgi:NACHT domain
MLVGPLMHEWQKLHFATTFELLRRVVGRLNQISEQLDALGSSAQQAADESFELSYRDYLLQRFYRIEAGTVRMTTNLNVDLPELFVMPRVQVCPVPEKTEGAEASQAVGLMELGAAREYFSVRRTGDGGGSKSRKEDRDTPVLEQVEKSRRLVIVGPPGGGKSTFLEWLQLKVAGAEVPFVLTDQQAIPMLLRVRELNPRELPRGATLVEKATASRDRATLMPLGWIERQMQAGRVLFMLDGLDETEPELRDQFVIPWLCQLCEDHPDCAFIVSSRPVGYPAGALGKLGFVDSDLLDFDDDQIREYCRHWCTAVRLAQNEPADEARCEGTREGDEVVKGFKDHPYIRDLAKNPLMLSAICLVNYFEHGKLPEDRALLYKLCVEGLLHHWDQRRGIHSEFSLDEKLRACREVAIAMQADNLAEYGSDRVEAIFAAVLRDSVRAKKLLEHIRYRTGLLIERRSGIFAFAHLTFQEYLAARAVFEGNRLQFDIGQLARDLADARWREVIPLFCGLATSLASREMLLALIEQPDTLLLASIIADAYFSAGPAIVKDETLCARVLQRIATAPCEGGDRIVLDRFLAKEVRPVANALVGTYSSDIDVTEAYTWLHRNPQQLDMSLLVNRLKGWRERPPSQTAELVLLVHAHGPDAVLNEIATDSELYFASAPVTLSEWRTQGVLALLALACGAELGEHRDKWYDIWRQESLGLPGSENAFIQILRSLTGPMRVIGYASFGPFGQALVARTQGPRPHDLEVAREFASLSRTLAKQYSDVTAGWPPKEVSVSKVLNAWAESLEEAIAKTKKESPRLRTSPAKSRRPRRRERK